MSRRSGGVPGLPAHRFSAPAHLGSVCIHSSLLASRNSCSFAKKASGLLLTGELLSRDPGVGKAPGAATWQLTGQGAEDTRRWHPSPPALPALSLVQTWKGPCTH